MIGKTNARFLRSSCYFYFISLDPRGIHAIICMSARQLVSASVGVGHLFIVFLVDPEEAQ